VDKRTFLKSIFLGSAGIVASGLVSKLRAAKTRKKWDGVFRLPELPYTYDALEPFIDAETMELHYTKHHAAYTDKLNVAVQEAGLTGKSAYELLKEVSKYPVAIRNNGGGYMNHKLFWKMLAPATDKKPSETLSSAIVRDFGSVDAFKDKFSAAAKSVFGSGWVWLIADENRNLRVIATFNQDSPLMDIASEKGIPILCLDVWEHAYYLKNQNRRADYINAFWNVVNWDFVSQRHSNAQKMKEG
jgi:Fe-Mn family superoxide dismutase